ncbi:MAG: hypothetical protein VX471_07005 [Acidobacteriota bacterium]|jgi:hypothetical protein|nr:hypothetical protein [Acidobacteriota bacterium]MCH2278476.1 hypothetical protein [Vicinamibacterales bacterium]MEC7769012.1 hypothetical protein [Acidobacteriota bacterium]|tara:strand:- start:36 stop:491 length:456 start_codon:yes stop_codon:yes gene_type:complete
MSKTAKLNDIPDGAPEATPQRQSAERFWPYIEPSSQPSPEELAELDPDLRAVMFGSTGHSFSITVVFGKLKDKNAYKTAVTLARQASEYREMGDGPTLRHRARYFPPEALALRDLFDIVGGDDACEVLIDDRPLPYARELWLPLVWFLIQR